MESGLKNIQEPLQKADGLEADGLELELVGLDDIFANVSGTIFGCEPRGRRHEVNAEIMLQDTFEQKCLQNIPVYYTVYCTVYMKLLTKSLSAHIFINLVNLISSHTCFPVNDITTWT